MNTIITFTVIICFLMYWVLEYQHQIHTSREWISKRKRRILGTILFGSYAVFMGMYVRNLTSSRHEQKTTCHDMSCEMLENNGEIQDWDGRMVLSFYDSYYIEEKKACMLFDVNSYLNKTSDGYLLEDRYQEYESVRKSSYAVDVHVSYNIYEFRPDKLEAYIEGNDEVIDISGYIHEQSGRPVTPFKRKYRVSLRDHVDVQVVG